MGVPNYFFQVQHYAIKYMGHESYGTTNLIKMSLLAASKKKLFNGWVSDLHGH